MKKETTFIKWVSVLDALPKEIKSVLVILEGDTEPSLGRFDPSFGWAITNSSASWMDTSKQYSPRAWKVKFWSEYNLPK